MLTLSASLFTHFSGSKRLTSLHLVNIQPNLKPHPPPKFSGSAAGDERSKFSIVGRSNKKLSETTDNFSMLAGRGRRAAKKFRGTRVTTF